jgi:hypothetical protein
VRTFRQNQTVRLTEFDPQVALDSGGENRIFLSSLEVALLVGGFRVSATRKDHDVQTTSSFFSYLTLENLVPSG